MWQALALAQRGRGLVEPNPMVGCVLVRDGQEIGRGFTAPFGGPHAEVQALADAKSRGQDPSGATAYTTLEPCSHTGKTGPCSKALIDAHIARAVVALVDPFGRVSGRGISAMREAGIEVHVGTCAAQAAEINAPFIKRVTTGMPYVTIKWASTLDGRIATHAGDSRWISNVTSRRRVHEMRACSDAVMVGVGTVMADDPVLTAREVEVKRVARRVVVDPELRTPPPSRIALGRDAADPPTTFAVDEEMLKGPGRRVNDYREAGIEIVGLPRLADHHLDLEPLMKHLVAAHDMTNVLVEGGAGLAGSLLKQGLVDRLIAFIAPKILGDDRALSAFAGLEREHIDESTLLTLHCVERIDDDVMLDYRVAAPDAS